MNDKKAIIVYSIIGLIVIFSTLVTSALLKNEDSDHFEDTSKEAITTEVQGNVTFTFINSGEGMASVIETSNGGIAVIDTGTGENPFLQDYIQGRKIDILLLTSLDTNHVGGLTSLLDTCPVEKCFFPVSCGLAAYDDVSALISAHEISITNDEQYEMDDVVIKPIDITEDNIAYMVVHGTDRLIYQGDQMPENAAKMLLSDDLKYSSITGIVAAKSGENAYFCSDLMRKHPKFLVANITENNEGNSQLTKYCKENNVDLYSFVANTMMPLHFSSTGNGLKLVGYE
ncbi:MBL fold metallo-hydrolase [Eubacterium sp. 1001713B170207_170306_E7]|uniref:MBL fold metallo-hydrolase n=1 Tax=Eubacterium sp. 1001713B170207_170306_E7 TaxID=2787097 RepID=UPI00189AF600|nr:MBL fold metallo-hydrolase [Eubacterium sp. 1001713B170207_170306_E7]